MLCKGVSAIYRKAILLALESLHDHQSRSNVDAVRRHTKSLLDENDYQWNEMLFMKTYKSIANSGEIEINANIMVELSPEFKRKRSNSIIQRLEQEQNAMKQVMINSPPLDSNFFHHSAPELLNQQNHVMASTMDQDQNSEGRIPKSKQDIPHRRSEHEKWKIMPKKIYDKTT